MTENSSAIPNWFNATLDWKALGAVVVTIVSLSYFGVTSWHDSKQQLTETRSAINQLSAKFDESMSKRDDRLTTLEREIRVKIDVASDRGQRERQILESRVIGLEARQELDDKRSREEAIVMATMREQVNTVLVTVNSLRELMVSASGANVNNSGNPIPRNVFPARPYQR